MRPPWKVKFLPCTFLHLVALLLLQLQLSSTSSIQSSLIMAPRKLMTVMNLNVPELMAGSAVAAAAAEDVPPPPAAYPGVDRWAGKPQALCRSCGQKTSTIDRHSPPGRPKWLHWVQCRESKSHVQPAANQQKPKGKAKTAAVKKEDM